MFVGGVDLMLRRGDCNEIFIIFFGIEGAMTFIRRGQRQKNLLHFCVMGFSSEKLKKRAISSFRPRFFY